MESFDGRAKEVFSAALNHPPADRRMFVEMVCRDDDALRREVESLLASHEENEQDDRDAAFGASSTDAFTAGEVFAGRYRMIARLGQGGMGDVWSADDLVLGLPVALKFLQSTSATGRALLLNEVRLARRITHPAVCRVFDIGEERGQVFLSMELVQGEDLAAFVHRVGRLPSDKVAAIGRRLCEALSAAHRQGILHRDLKPANILIDESGSVRITDFGIAVTRDAGGHNTGIGTPGYMAPEQLLSGATVSERTDIYALGLVLYEILVGRRTADLAPSVHQLPRPSAIVDGIDPRLERIVMQALSPDPSDRQSSADEMAAQLTMNPPGGITSRVRFGVIALGIAAVAAILALVTRPSVPGVGNGLTEQDTILLADFVNTTGEPVFDGTLKVALAVALEQSPFIKVFPDDRVRDALRLMNRPADERLTRSVAREIAQRERLKALLTGSIASLGRNYVIGIEAINAQTADVMAREQVEVAQKEQVLASLGQAAARLREKLGESLASIQKFDVPLPRATTSSLEALHAYALALDQDRLVARVGSVPHLKRAIELDPDFALAHALLSGVYANTRRSTLAPAHAQRAFELRDRVSERERFFISWRYFHDATQDWDKALDLARTWTATYPREAFAFNSLGAVFSALGQYEQAIPSFEMASRLDPSFVAPIESLGPTFMALNRYGDVKAVVRRAGSLRPDLLSLRRFAYVVALIEGDAPAMARELDAARRLPDGVVASDWEARTDAFAGRVQNAHQAFRRAVEAATQAQLVETAAQWSAVDAETHALMGQCAEARRDATAALALNRDNSTLEHSGRALALCGAHAEVSTLSTELADRFPAATLTRRIHLPVMAAALAIRGGESKRGLALLEPVAQYDHARGAEFWPAYLRGQAYLASKNGVEAGKQFEAILNHRGEAPDSPVYALAHLGAARAATLTGEIGKARQSYDAFVALWRDADADLPALLEARAERARLR
jgi:eukaryotic-like serine/threonine-protein kinase